MKAKTIALTLALSGFALAATAQTATPVVNTKQKTQRVRIAHGVANGSLTRREAKALKMEQRHIRRVERRAKADGVVTPRERARLARKQKIAGRHITRGKNN